MEASKVFVSQGCAGKMGLCEGEDHSITRLAAEFVLFEETFTPSA
jgi:hypothetical protein